MNTLNLIIGGLAMMITLVSQQAIAGVAEEHIKGLIEERANAWLDKQFPYLKINYANNDDAAQEDGWIVDYDWSRSGNRVDLPDTDLAGLQEGDTRKFRMLDSGFTAHAKGSYAYNDTTNSNDLSSAGLTFHMRVVDQGLLVKMNEADRIESVKCIGDLELPDNPTDADMTAYDAKSKECSARYFQLQEEHSTHTYAYDLQLAYQVEANQDYTEHQEVYSLGTTLVFEPAIGSAWQAANVLDYPFRYITRPLFSRDAHYNARWPSLHLAYGTVDPSKNSVRNALPQGDESYDRWHGEIAFQSQVAKIANYPITFETSYRVYREVSAPDAVKAADLGEFTYSTTSLFAPASLFGVDLENHEIYITYVHGKLPFDVATKETLLLGWKFNLDVLFSALLEDTD